MPPSKHLNSSYNSSCNNSNSSNNLSDSERWHQSHNSSFNSSSSNEQNQVSSNRRFSSSRRRVHAVSPKQSSSHGKEHPSVHDKERFDPDCSNHRKRETDRGGKDPQEFITASTAHDLYSNVSRTGRDENKLNSSIPHSFRKERPRSNRGCGNSRGDGRGARERSRRDPGSHRTSFSSHSSNNRSNHKTRHKHLREDPPPIYARHHKDPPPVNLRPAAHDPPSNSSSDRTLDRTPAPRPPSKSPRGILLRDSEKEHVDETHPQGPAEKGKVSNTAQITMEKYKQLYESILQDPSSAFLFLDSENDGVKDMSKSNESTDNDSSNDIIPVEGKNPQGDKSDKEGFGSNNSSNNLTEEKDLPSTSVFDEVAASDEDHAQRLQFTIDDIVGGMKFQDMLQNYEKLQQEGADGESILSHPYKGGAIYDPKDGKLVPTSRSLNKTKTVPIVASTELVKREKKSCGRSPSPFRNPIKLARPTDRTPSPGAASVGSRGSSSQKSQKSGKRLSFGVGRRRRSSGTNGGSVFDSDVDSNIDDNGDETETEYDEDHDVVGDLNTHKMMEDGRKKKGLFRKMKKFAKGVSRKFAPGAGPHTRKFKVGDKARYNVGKIRDSFETFENPDDDPTVEVEIVGVHTDAVLEMPYYTIQLPDGSRKQTDMEHLLPNYDQRASAVGEDRSVSTRSSSRHRKREGEERPGRRRSRHEDETSVKSDKSSSSRRSVSRGRHSRRSASPSPSRKSQRRSSNADRSNKRSSSRSKPRELSRARRETAGDDDNTKRSFSSRERPSAPLPNSTRNGTKQEKQRSSSARRPRKISADDEYISSKRSTSLREPSSRRESAQDNVREPHSSRRSSKYDTKGLEPSRSTRRTRRSGVEPEQPRRRYEMEDDDFH